MIRTAPRTVRWPNSRRGFALLAVLWVVVLASLILLGVRRNSWANSAAARNDLGTVQARWLARAGVEQALAVLTDDPSDADGATDLWYDDLEDFQEFPLAGGTFTVSAPSDDQAAALRYGLLDHAGMLNIGTADANQLAELNILDDSQIDSILDWIDTDDEIRTGGAEAGYYNHLAFPYEIRNGRLRTLAELRLVKGIDDEAFCGEDTNLNGRLDKNEDDGAVSPPDDDSDGILRLGLAGLCTVYSYEQNNDAQGQPRINLSRAGRNTLTQQLNFTDALADAVSQQRRGRRLRSVMDLVGVKGQSSTSDPSSGGSAGSSGTSGGSSASPTAAPSGSGSPAGGTTGRSGGTAGDSGATGGSSSGGSSSVVVSSSSQGDSGRVNEITLRWIADHLDQVTVSNRRTLRGLVNVNTAGKDVLMALGLSPDSAEALVARRVSAKGDYTSVGQLLGDPLSEAEFRAVAERCTVRSNVFEVRSRGVTDLGIHYDIAAVIDRGTSPVTLLYWYESE